MLTHRKQDGGGTEKVYIQFYMFYSIQSSLNSLSDIHLQRKFLDFEILLYQPPIMSTLNKGLNKW